MHIQLNGEPHQVAHAITLETLLRELEISPQQIAVEVNLDLIPRAQHATHQLAEDDQVEIVRLVGGG